MFHFNKELAIVSWQPPVLRTDPLWNIVLSRIAAVIPAAQWVARFASHKEIAMSESQYDVATPFAVVIYFLHVLLASLLERLLVYASSAESRDDAR